MLKDVLYNIAYHCTSNNLGFVETLKYEHWACEEWGIPYNRHIKRRLDTLKRQIMDNWER